MQQALNPKPSPTLLRSPTQILQKALPVRAPFYDFLTKVLKKVGYLVLRYLLHHTLNEQLRGDSRKAWTLLHTLQYSGLGLGFRAILNIPKPNW